MRRSQASAVFVLKHSQCYDFFLYTSIGSALSGILYGFLLGAILKSLQFLVIRLSLSVNVIYF